MKNILVPIDFSDASFNAISYAAFLANAFESNLLLLHVYSDNSAYEEYKKSTELESEKELETLNEKYLKKEIGRIAKRYTVKIKGLVQKGNPVNVIREVAEKKNSDIIVMGMKGKGESNSIFGSTTTSMINKTSVPLLVIPFNAAYKTIDTIVLTSDFNDKKLLSNFTILEQFISKFDPFIQILNVQKKDSDLTSKMIADKTRVDLQWNKYSYSFNIIEKNNIEEGINKFMKKHPSDMLVMVARRHNFVKQIFGISHTKKMIQQSKIPLLILHESKI